MGGEAVALMPRCTECGAEWLPADEERWRAYLGGDEFIDPPELAFYCRCLCRLHAPVTNR